MVTNYDQVKNFSGWPCLPTQKGGASLELHLHVFNTSYYRAKTVEHRVVEFQIWHIDSLGPDHKYTGSSPVSILH